MLAQARPNVFALSARRAKVLALLAFVPCAPTTEGNIRVALTLASWTQADRDRFARGHRINVPSQETWAELCKAVRSRKGAS